MLGLSRRSRTGRDGTFTQRTAHLWHIYYISWPRANWETDFHTGDSPQNIYLNASPMPRELVDRIPLAVYIPATIQGETNSPSQPKSTVDGTKPGSRKATRVKLFRFFRRQTGDDPKAVWHKSEHPFVKPESNQAICAVCKVDFELPRRVGTQIEDDAEAEALRLLACGHAFYVS
ncbi:hypothetical protein FRC12_004252 [Ceratobasidium sp. 428]|nr:hypothetical protein FRC12_004252 [Ceratobasidium sp. 428]